MTIPARKNIISSHWRPTDNPPVLLCQLLTVSWKHTWCHHDDLICFSPGDWNVWWKNFFPPSFPLAMLGSISWPAPGAHLLSPRLSALGLVRIVSPPCWFPSSLCSYYLMTPRRWWLCGEAGAIQSIAALKRRAELSCHVCGGQIILTSQEIFLKRGIFHQDKTRLWIGTWNGFICCPSLQNMWKEIRQINEERQGGGMIARMQPSVQEVPDRQVAKRQGRMGEEKERCRRRSTIFYMPYFPSLPRQDRILVEVEFLSEPE